MYYVHVICFHFGSNAFLWILDWQIFKKSAALDSPNISSCFSVLQLQICSSISNVKNKYWLTDMQNSKGIIKICFMFYNRKLLATSIYSNQLKFLTDPKMKFISLKSDILIVISFKNWISQKYINKSFY